MGTLHYIQQTEPVWCASGAVLWIHRGREGEVRAAVKEAKLAIYVEEVPIAIVTHGCNIGDGEYRETREVVVVQPGSKHYGGWELAVDLLERIAPHLEDAHFFMHPEEGCGLLVSSIRIRGGRVVEEKIPDAEASGGPAMHMWLTTHDPVWFGRALVMRGRHCELCGADDVPRSRFETVPGALDLEEACMVCASCLELLEERRTICGNERTLVEDHWHEPRYRVVRRAARRIYCHFFGDGDVFIDSIDALDPRTLYPSVDPRERQLLEALDRDPDDRTTWLVYADWLEAHGRPEEAGFWRQRSVAP